VIRLGVDIGGTKTHAVAVDAAGTVVADSLIPTGLGPEEILLGAERALRTAAELTGLGAEDAASIGVGVPGSVDRRTGVVSHAVNLDLDELPLGELLGARLGRPVVVENDVKAAALGAFHLDGLDGGFGRGADRATGSMAYLNLGTGLAAGLVLDGRLWRGANGVAGEIGHIPVHPDHGDLCLCGQRGCLETVASGGGLARRWPQGRGRVAALFDAADAGDAVAAAVREDFVSGVAAAVRLLVLTTGVDKVVIGGGLSTLGDRLRSAVVAVLDDWSAQSPFVASLALPDRVRVLPPQSPVGAVGAALLGR